MQNRATALQKAKDKALTQLRKHGKTAAINCLVKEMREHPELQAHPMFEQAEHLCVSGDLDNRDEVQSFILSLK